jgi:hypothetical protein
MHLQMLSAGEEEVLDPRNTKLAAVEGRNGKARRRHKELHHISLKLQRHQHLPTISYRSKRHTVEIVHPTKTGRRSLVPALAEVDLKTESHGIEQSQGQLWHWPNVNLQR